MTTEKREEITKIAQEFASGFEPDIPINGSAWLIADPLSGYLNAMGFENTPVQIPERNGCPQVLILIFEDGWQFIPAGGDLKPLHDSFHNYIWVPLDV